MTTNPYEQNRILREALEHLHRVARVDDKDYVAVTNAAEVLSLPEPSPIPLAENSPQISRPTVSLWNLVCALEGAARNTDTDWRWKAAVVMRTALPAAHNYLIPVRVFMPSVSVEAVARAIFDTPEPHTHQSWYNEAGEITDICRRCGKDIRDERHIRAGETLDDVRSRLQAKAAIEACGVKGE